MTTARPGARPCVSAEGDDVVLDGRPDVCCDRRPEQQPWVPARLDRRGQPERRSVTRRSDSGWRAAPVRTTSRVATADCSISRSRSSTRTRQLGGERLVTRHRQVDQHVRGGAPGAGLCEQGGDDEVGRRVGVAAAGERLGRGHDVAAGLDRAERRERSGPSGGPDRRAADLALGVRLLGQLEGGREPGVGSGVVVGEPEAAVGELGTGEPRPSDQRGVGLVLRATLRERRRPSRRGRRGQRGGDRRRAAATGRRLRRSESVRRSRRGSGRGTGSAPASSTSLIVAAAAGDRTVRCDPCGRPDRHGPWPCRPGGGASVVPARPPRAPTDALGDRGGAGRRPG